MDRRKFIGYTGASVALGGFYACSGNAEGKGEPPQQETGPPAAIAQLQPMHDGVTPISDEERKQRIAKAQALMEAQGIAALFLEPSTSMQYFLDLDFWKSERMVAAIIPAKGDPIYICPAFEEGKISELIKFGNEIRVWQEHESPFKLVADLVKGIAPSGKLAIEERTRFFLVNGIRKAAAGLEIVSGDPISAGCRMYKSAAELELMQHANRVTIAAYKAVVASLYEGMTQHDFREMAITAHKALGYSGYISANFAEASAFPHGSSKTQYLKEGDVVLMDGGCSVAGYRSDISRTIVFGKPNERQRSVWEIERQAQDAAIAAAVPGAPCEAVDAAARSIIEQAGFGPGYRYFSHRVGHGIGMDGHEWTYLVKGNTTPLQPGMCFSDEPGIYIEGEFGVRLEDCFYMTEDGPVFFTEQSPSIEQPFASSS